MKVTHTKKHGSHYLGVMLKRDISYQNSAELYVNSAGDTKPEAIANVLKVLDELDKMAKSIREEINIL